MRGELVDTNHFYLHLVTQAGTYIKEFVHGDFGVPNMCELLAQDVDILTLDVLEIRLECMASAIMFGASMLLSIRMFFYIHRIVDEL